MSAVAQELDGKLIAICREFQEAEATFAAWNAERDFMPFDHPRAKEIDKLEQELVSRRHEIREEVAELKAHTPEGLQAKARIVLTELAEEGDPNKEVFNHQYLAAVSLARDVLDRTATTQDAELISTAAAMENAERQIHSYNRDVIPLTEVEVEELLGVGHELALRLMAMRPVTREGLLAKARAFELAMDNLIANIPGETVESMGAFDQLLAWSLVGDILGKSRASVTWPTKKHTA